MYKNKKWLYEQRVKQMRKLADIAKECGVSRRTISHFVTKYSIPEPPKESDVFVTICCSRCKESVEKRLRYLKQRIRKGEYKFFCTNCLRINKTEEMTGTNNPNYGGTFHGLLPSMWPPEKRALMGRKLSETIRLKGLNKGANNPRWAGGSRKVNCVVCGKQTEVRPYVYRKIQNGEQSACCNEECSSYYARTHVKYKHTSIEIKMAEELSHRNIEYIEQYNLGNKFALDFFLPEYDIVIECDGDYWHNRPETIKRDKSKNAYIRKCGYSLYRFWEHEINEDIAACVDVVMGEINERDAIAN